MFMTAFLLEFKLTPTMNVKIIGTYDKYYDRCRYILSYVLRCQYNSVIGLGCTSEWPLFSINLKFYTLVILYVRNIARMILTSGNEKQFFYDNTFF